MFALNKPFIMLALCVYIPICIYIYIYREREREIYYMCIHIYIYICCLYPYSLSQVLMSPYSTFMSFISLSLFYIRSL